MDETDQTPDKANPLDLLTDEELVECLRDRLHAKELAYLFVWACDHGDDWMIADHIDYDHLQDIYELCMEDFEQEILNTDTWDPEELNKSQFDEDFEEDED